ncbi:MAG: ATP-binding protein [Bacteroidales bacterium]|nr:ATP-binding protein [Bacteroidales bacterium]
MAGYINNPFIIAGYEAPEYFCDRKKETEGILEALRNGRNVTLTSPRRIGKTGLILHLFHLLKKQKKGTMTIYIDLFPTSSLSDFAKLFADSVLGQLDSNPVKLFKKVVSVFKWIRPNMTVDEITGQPKLGLDIVQGTEDRTIEEVFKYLKESGKECYIAFDEFQQVAQYPEKNVEALLRTYIQNIHNVHFIFSGSRKHMLSEMFLSPKRPFYQSASSMSIGVIAEKEYWNFAASFFKEQGRELPEDVFHLIYETYEGYTWYVQKVLNQMYGKAGREVNSNLVYEAIAEILKENEYYYQMLLKMYSSGRGKLLKAIAQEKKVKEITSGAFIAKYDLTAASSVKSALERLLDDEIIYQEEDGYIVYDRFFGQWLAQN